MAKLVGSNFGYRGLEFFGLNYKVPWQIESDVLLMDKKSHVFVSTFLPISDGVSDKFKSWGTRLRFNLKTDDLYMMREDILPFAKKYSKYQPYRELSGMELGDFVTMDKKSAEALHSRLVKRLLKKY